MENKFLGTFKGKDVFGNEAAAEALDWLREENQRLLRKLHITKS